MHPEDTSDDRARRRLVQAALLGLLLLTALAMALLALAMPDINVELPLAPSAPDYPISPHGF
jgi:hypothetical protein